jgi:tetratricopeptide (TPR) repeat protein
MLRHLWQVGFLAVFTVLMLTLLRVTAPAVYLFVVGVVIMAYAVVWAWLRTLHGSRQQAATIVVFYAAMAAVVVVAVGVGVYSSSQNAVVALVAAGVVGVLLGLFFYVRTWGTVLAIAGDVEGAIKHFSTIIATRARNRSAYLYRAQLRQQIGDRDGAARDYTAVLHRQPENLTALTNHAGVALAQHDYQQALRDYDKALDLQPGLATAYLGRINAHIGLGHYEHAIRACNDGLKQQIIPFVEAALYLNRGLAHFLHGEHAQALDDYNAALEVDTRAEDTDSVRYLAATNCAFVAIATGDYEAALADLNTAESIFPGRPRTTAGAALVAYEHGDRDEAVTLWRDLVRQNANYANVMWVRAELNWTPALTETADQIIALLNDS